ncbi:MAG: hypothetical protein H7Y38_03520 [Armatimonadetes bacterium]|nr:hypothetical protein [Armatimonadota bacterium]
MITSPPYFNQREYGAPGGVGNEETLAVYLDNLLRLFAECVRYCGRWKHRLEYRR